ncbi:hypothetical protein IAT40_003682 [Kwoniella sp. CBS 6097]
MSYPYLAKTTLKYKSPHSTDLSFAKDETIRVTGPSDDDEDWLIGETLDGSRSGGFPKDFITPMDEEVETTSTTAESAPKPPAAISTTSNTEPAEVAAASSTTASEPTDAPSPMLPAAEAPPSPKLEPATLPPASVPPPSQPAAEPSESSQPKPNASAPEPTAVPAATATQAPGDSPPRPQSMKDRLAFFAAAAQTKAPPPPIKPKPATGGLTWSQRQKLRQEQEAKEREEGGSSAATAPSSHPAAAPAAAPLISTSSEPAAAASNDEKDEKEGTGMSAADALSSISKGGSLKERMAALQGHGAFGGGNAGGSAEKPPPPVSSGKVWKRPPAPPAPEPELEPESETDLPTESRQPKPEKELSAGSESLKSPVTEEGDALAKEGAEHEGEQEEEEDEEEKEKARRAAIAARMAKLGARGPMGMMPPGPAPPKPARKPTREPENATSSPVEEKKELIPAVSEAAPGSTDTDATAETKAEPQSPAVASTETAASEPAAVPKSVPIAAMPRRTAPPRRRGPAASSATAASSASPEVARQDPVEPENRFENTDEDGAPVPPPQVMVPGEEKPLPKTEAGQQKEAADERRGKEVGGLEGAAAAGIALAPVSPAEQKSQNTPSQQLEPEVDERQSKPLVGAIGNADSEDRGTGAVALQEGEGEIIDINASPQEVEEGIPEGGDEKDDIMREAEQGRLDFEVDDSPPLEEGAPTPLSPDPIGMVPLHPPAPEGADYDEDEPPPPPPRRRGMSLDIPLDELEMKHDHEHAHDIDRSEHAIVTEEDGHDQEEEEEIPPPPPRRTSVDRPLGPRPLPSPGKSNPLPPPPTGNPLVPPRDEDEDEDEEEDEIATVGQTGDAEDEEAAPPLPPHRHATQSSASNVDEDEETAPPPPPARSIPPPASEPTEDEEETAPPPPPARQPLAPTQSVAESEETPAPPPPARKPSLPAPLQMGVPVPASGPKSPVSPQAARSPIVSSPTRSRTLVEEPASSPTAPAEDEDASRRSGIAARMAKLGGIKFGMPPPTFKKPSANVTSPTSEETPAPAPARVAEEPTSPIDKEPPIPSPNAEKYEPNLSPAPAAAASSTAGDGEETAEQEAARRRATLARLRAGGALGFGMFNHGPSAEEPKEDARGLEEESVQVPTASEVEDDEAPPPPPPGRPAVPAGRPMPPAPAEAHNEEPHDETAPPPPPARPTISTDIGETGVNPPSARAPQSPIQAHPSPVRSPSGRRPPVPAEKRFSQTHIKRASSSSAFIPEDRPASGTDWQLADEPAVMMANQSPSQSRFEESAEDEQEAPPPPPPARPPPPPAQEPAPRRSMSIASRLSRKSIDVPPATPPKATQQQSQQQIPQSPVQGHPSPARQSSVGQGVARPGFDQLKEASATAGAGLARAAQGMFAQGKKAYFGDGSPAGFVFVAMDHAHISRPQQGWGQIIFEQEGGSILRRYDEPRPGDIAAFHDAKLKGKKGLSTYNQHVGSVEEPLVGVVVEFEDRKHKLRVLQVERGTPEEVSYRCEDLKSGKIVVYRPGL